MQHFMGKDGFYWFFGKVVNRDDPLCLGRAKVRVFGIHPQDDNNLVQDEHLPWAMPIQPIYSAGIFGVGHSPVGLLPGSIVFGFFADGSDAQVPFILGTVAGGIEHFGVPSSAVPFTPETPGVSANTTSNLVTQPNTQPPTSRTTVMPTTTGTPNAEFWTLVAICIREAGNSENGQCDVAQSIYNRILNYRSFLATSPSIVGVVTARGQYEPTWRYPTQGSSGVPNQQWRNITDLRSAMAATGSNDSAALLACAHNLKNAALQENSKNFVGARTDFLGTTQSARSFIQPYVVRPGLSNKFGHFDTREGRRIRAANRVAAVPSTVVSARV